MQDNHSSKLVRAMKSRHLIMIAIGGTISASFFMGSGGILHSVGAFGTVLAFLFGGFLMFLVVLSLAEMAVAMPISGSFQTYATQFISPLAGFLTGWLYFFNWVTAAAASLTAASMIMHMWFPHSEPWQWSLLFMLQIAALNFFPVKAFGEIEFWFAGIKIAAIILFILIGTALIFDLIPGIKHAAHWENFSNHGLFPNGYLPFIYGLVVVVCMYQGAELVGITAGESADPANNVKKAIKSVGFRILLFFVLSIIIVAVLMPVETASISNSPFIYILHLAKIPYIDGMMQGVIIIASLSAVNSAYYACPRLLWAMANSQQAPKSYAALNRYGVPYLGVVLTCALSGLTLLSAIKSIEQIFMLIIASSGMIGCYIWIMISWCHIGFRKHLKQTGRDPKTLSFRVHLYPWVPMTSMVLNALVIMAMFCDPSQRTVVYSGIVLILFFVAAYFLVVKPKKDESMAAATVSGK